jgi:predicted ATP-binding protein involved in virulence
MTDAFITAIHVKKVCNIEDFTIPLSETERKHLVITGKNGSGKTSLLREINKFIHEIIINPHGWYERCIKEINQFKEQLLNTRNVNERLNLEQVLKQREFIVAKYGNIKLTFYKLESLHKDLINVFFEAKRVIAPLIPQGINKVNLLEHYQSTDNANKDFIQYIVNLKAERSFAKDDNDLEAVERIDVWFANFENQLKNLFDAPDLQLIFDRQNYNFHIQIGDHEPFTFTQLSDGYSAVISIVTELIMRMEALGNKRYDQQGIVLVDEIETHLHVALQKKIMPFLCAFFPNIQFIVTTHSPFVLSSLSNAVVCDLESREVITDLSGYSYEALVEGYFEADKYSEILKAKLARFEALSAQAQENDEYRELKRYFDNLPLFFADELAVKLQQIKLQKLARKG